MELTYRYTPVSTARSTRVIEIRPALMSSATVVIKIHETRIDQPQIAYEAVSYTWDGQIPDQPIRCHQKRLHVTKNAHDILRRLRRSRRPRFIWIDAICIDQTCEQDKNRQIAMMADIYRTAKHVVVWLGDVAPRLASLHRAIQALRKSFSFLDALWDRVLSIAPVSSPATNSCLNLRTPLSHLEHLEHRVSRALDAVLHHPDWQRAWTAQEFALNQKCSLQFSHGQIPKKEFKELLHLSKDTVKPFRLVHLATWLTDTGSPSGGPASSIDSRFNEIFSIFECLPQLRSQLPVDRVFALVSVYPRLLGNVTIDYRCKPAKVYTEAAMCIIQNTGHLSILSFAGSDWGGEVVELASWVPDWSMTRAPLPVCGIWLRQLYRRRRLAGSMPSSFDGRGVKLRSTRHPIQRGNSGLREDKSGCPRPIFDLSRALSEGILQVKGVFVAEVSDTVSDVMGHSKGVAFLSASVRRFGSASLKDQLTTCMECFEKHFKSYFRLIQAPDEEEQQYPPVDTSITSQGSERLALRAWVETCVDELTMDPDMMECMQLYDLMINTTHHGTRWESTTYTLCRGDGQFEMVKDMEAMFSFISSGQRLFMTEDGTLGISERVEPGDRVALIAGCDKPFIIRQNVDAQSFERYRLIGEAYLNGVQDGQKWPTNDRETTDIFLV